MIFLRKDIPIEDRFVRSKFAQFTLSIIPLFFSLGTAASAQELDRPDTEDIYAETGDDRIHTLLERSISQCAAELNRKNSLGIHPDFCLLDKTTRVTRDDLCGFYFDPNFLNLSYVDELMSDCFPKKIFGDVDHSINYYNIKRQIFEESGRPYGYDEEVIMFDYSVVACEGGEVNFSGIMYIGYDSGEIYSVVNVPAICFPKG